ncbi:MAG: fumarate hydratase [Candidatus Thermoplasmatota archaeon]|nr:fumarate hydratase [Candidatus Thermoplasmatota archaeon]
MEDNLVEAIREAVTSVTGETEEALRSAKEVEEKEGPQVQLDAILENIEVGKDEKRPICQDTGTQTFFIEAGEDFQSLGIVRKAIDNAVKKATESVPLRPNAVDPISDANSDDNTGRFIPALHWDIVEGDEVTIHVMPKGGGSENMSKLEMMTPGRGIKGVKEIVLEHIAEMEGKACAPTIVAVGLGGGSDLALELAKKALQREVGERHPEERIADLEEELMEKANQLGVGPMGVGGETTVLDVKIEYAHRHPASFPVAVVPQCWANRQSKVKITSDGNIEVIK